MEEQPKKTYEVSFLARTENGAATMVGYLVSLGADIINEGSLNKMKLSYPIDKEESAYFGCITCNLRPDAVSKVHDAIRLDKEILRAMILTPMAKRQEAEVKERHIPAAPAAEGGPVELAKSEEKEDSALSNELLEEKLEEILK